MKSLYMVFFLVFLFTYVSSKTQIKKQKIDQLLIDSLDRVIDQDSSTIVSYLDIIDKIYNINPKSAEELTKKTIAKSENLGIPEFQFQCNKYLTVIYLEMSLYDKAQKSLIEMEKLMVLHQIESYQGTMYTTMGLFYYAQGIYEEALVYYRKSLAFYRSVNNRKSIATGLNNIGSVYLEIEKYDSALYYYNKTLEIKRILGDQKSIAITVGNLGSLYNSLGEMDKALRFLLEADQIYETYNNKTNLALIKRLMASTYLQLENPEAALQKLIEAEQLAKATLSPKMMFLTYLEYAQYYNYLKDFEKAFQYQQKFSTLRDSVYNFNKANAIQQIKSSYEKEKQQIAMQLKEQAFQLIKVENERRRIIHILLVTILISVGVLAFFIISHLQSKVRKDRLIHEQSEQIQELQLTQLKDQLEQKNRELTTTALEIIKKNEALAEIRTELQIFKTESDSTNQKRIKAISGLIDKSFDTDKNWEDFKLVFGQVHSNFFNKVKQLNADLSPAEIKLCSLLKLNFSSKEIGNLLGISADSVKTSRSRLRKKLQLERGINLVEFMISL